MRWKAKEKLPIGSRRTITRFALFPKRVGNYWIWLERYPINQILTETIDLSVELSDKGSMMHKLSEEERKEIAVILSRRANEIAEFKADYTKDRSHFGSVEMALSREIARLRDLSNKIDVTEEED